LVRIGALYDVEGEIRGKPPDERRTVRQARSKPLLDSLREWFETTLSKLSRKSDTTAAIRYALSRWDALTRFVDDGHIEIDNNAAERSLRGVALGRKNYLFAGSDAGGERAAAIYSLIGSAKLNDLDPRSLSTRRSDSHRRAPHQPHRGATALESRRKRATHERNRSLKHNAGASDSDDAGLPHIAELIVGAMVALFWLKRGHQFGPDSSCFFVDQLVPLSVGKPCIAVQESDDIKEDQQPCSNGHRADQSQMEK